MASVAMQALHAMHNISFSSHALTVLLLLYVLPVNTACCCLIPPATHLSFCKSGHAPSIEVDYVFNALNSGISSSTVTWI
jgi:hypothetical protein